MQDRFVAWSLFLILPHRDSIEQGSRAEGDTMPNELSCPWSEGRGGPQFIYSERGKTRRRINLLFLFFFLNVCSSQGGGRV